jgi:uncharacterized membrane protein YheB (UPF0754 family)
MDIFPQEFINYKLLRLINICRAKCSNQNLLLSGAFHHALSERERATKVLEFLATNSLQESRERLDNGRDNAVQARRERLRNNLVQQTGDVGSSARFGLAANDVRREVNANPVAVDSAANTDRMLTIHLDNLSSDVKDVVRRLTVDPVVWDPLGNTLPLAFFVLANTEAGDS